jgi:hypothetical protein
MFFCLRTNIMHSLFSLLLPAPPLLSKCMGGTSIGIKAGPTSALEGYTCTSNVPTAGSRTFTVGGLRQRQVGRRSSRRLQTGRSCGECETPLARHLLPDLEWSKCTEKMRRAVRRIRKIAEDASPLAFQLFYDML